MTERYTLARDNDAHWYVIPVSRQKEWDEWLEIDEDDERAWDAPDFAQRVGGSYSLVTFTDPVIAYPNARRRVDKSSLSDRRQT